MNASRSFWSIFNHIVSMIANKPHSPLPPLGPKLPEQLKAILKAGAAVKFWQKQAKNSKQRVNILREWVATEHSYIEDLRTIENSIQKPLKEAKLISSDEERMLFPNLKAMAELSLDLLGCIEEALAAWNPHTVVIGERIKAISKFFMIYREYCNNFMKGQVVIKELKNNPETLKI
jgi:hypothetical protein